MFARMLARLGLAPVRAARKMARQLAHEPQFAVVAEGDMQHLHEVQRELRSQGLRAEVIAPPSGCGSG
jgi:hypothetical protein